MNLNSGTLYFINEKDIKTGESLNYYKIGIVKESSKQDSEKRLLQHQTGNPRKLCIIETLKMPAVEAVETNLHYLFARNRVMGEWMSFTDVELQKAISKAKELSEGMKENIKDFQRANELGNIQSNEKIIPASEEAKKLYAGVMNFNEVINSCKKVKILYEDYLRAANEKGIDIGGEADMKSRKGAIIFDAKLFLKNYPDLYKEYSMYSNPIEGSFRLKPDKDWKFDISTIESDQFELISDFKKQLDHADYSLEMRFLLHANYLGVLEIRKFADWESDIAKLKLKVITGDAVGIEGVCTWKRKAKEVISLDEEKIEADHPAEYNACLKRGADTEALIVKPRIADK